MWQRIYPKIVKSIDIENNMKLLQFQPETKQNIIQVWEFGKWVLMEMEFTLRDWLL